MHDQLHDQLHDHELHYLWHLMPEHRRLAFLGALSEEACQQLLAFQLRQREGEERARQKHPKDA